MRQATRSNLAQILAIVGILAALAFPAAAQRGRGQDEPDPLARHTRARIAEVFDRIEAGGEIKDGITQARVIFDEALAYSSLDRPEALRDAALAVRLLEQLDAATSVARAPILRYLRANGGVAAALAFLVTEHDEPDRVYWRLGKIIDSFPQEAAELPALTAAICVVHEGPVERPRDAPPAVLNPVEIFNYFRDIPGAVLDYKSFPPEVLVYLVNTRASPAELEWAHMQYDGQRNLGAYYASITYDHDFFRGEADAKIASKPYTLPNVQLEGGVCEDQAYYAEHIGKAVGIPSVTSVGRGGEMSHAWIGFLRKGGRTGYRWDFSEARWGDYTDVVGKIVEPHTGLYISEAAVKLTLNMIGADRAGVEQAVALADGVKRLGKLKGQRSYPPPPPQIDQWQAPAPREATLEAQLAMLETALSFAPGRSDIWTAVIPLAESGEMPYGQKRRWASALLGYVDKDQHDFVMEILRPMFKTEPPEQQLELWQWAIREFRGRPDLLCQSMMEQAAAMAALGDRDGAFRTLEAAATRFVNETSWAIDATFAAEMLLVEHDALDQIIPMYARVFQRINKPRSRIRESAVSGSTCMRIGRRYQALLEKSGNQRMARRISDQLDALVRKIEE